jgi:putative hydrolase of the HAD superfamily
MSIKAVFFDAAGTLITPVRPVGQTYTLFAKSYGMEVSSFEISQRFRTCFAASPPLTFGQAATDSFEQLERNWWKNLVQCVFEPFGHFEQFDRFFIELFSYFARPEAWTLYPDVLETLSALQKRGLALDVISNFDSRLIEILEGLGMSGCFEEVFISSRVGHAKPASQIFETALKRHNLAPGEAMHVGDSEENDLYGAANAGLVGVLINRSANTPPRDYRQIKTLNEVISILDQV